MKFLIDANMPRSTKASLEALGHDLADVRDILSPAAPDSEVASLAALDSSFQFSVKKAISSQSSAISLKAVPSGN